MKKYIVVCNDSEKEYINTKIHLNNLIFLNENNYKDKKQAIKYKSMFGAKKTPFIGVLNNKQLVRGYYSEVSNNTINEFINDVQRGIL